MDSTRKKKELIVDIEKIKLQIKLNKKHGDLKRIKDEKRIDVFNFYTNKWNYDGFKIKTLQKHKEMLTKIYHEILKI